MLGLFSLSFFIFTLSILFNVELIILKRFLSGQKYSEDEYIIVAKRNIKRLFRDNSTIYFIDNLKVFYVDNLKGDTRGQCHSSLFTSLVLIKSNTILKQHVIEHELLHAVDFYLGITKKTSFKNLIDDKKSKEERKNWILKKFPGYEPRSIEEYVDHTDQEKSYWLSNSELFVTLNNLRLYMFKKNIIKYGDHISKETINKVVEQLKKEKNITAVDFFTALTFIRMENDHDINRLNNFYKLSK